MRKWMCTCNTPWYACNIHGLIKECTTTQRAQHKQDPPYMDAVTEAKQLKKVFSSKEKILKKR